MCTSVLFRSLCACSPALWDITLLKYTLPFFISPLCPFPCSVFLPVLSFSLFCPSPCSVPPLTLAQTNQILTIVEKQVPALSPTPDSSSLPLSSAPTSKRALRAGTFYNCDQFLQRPNDLGVVVVVVNIPF